MDCNFFDSSALVKRYTSEIGSTWVESLLDPSAANLIYIAGIAPVEVVSAITRRQRGGSFSLTDAQSAIAHFRSFIQTSCRIVPIDEILISQAMDLAEKYVLRGYDAVQLAAALLVHNERLAFDLSAPTLISSDLALNEAAIAKGLTVDDPNLH
jgi:uncharacterized protein